MNLKEYITEYLPKKCGVHPSFGEVAWIVFCEEGNGNKAFASDKFKTVRERAALGMPYKPKVVKEYEKGLDVLTIGMLCHGQEKHLENNDPEIEDLEKKRFYDDVEISVLANRSEWWNA